MSTPSNNAVNPTNYPLTGGIKPSSASFPTELNPEIHRLQEENAKLQGLLKDQAAELLRLSSILEVREQQIAQYYELLQVVLGKSVKNTL